MNTKFPTPLPFLVGSPLHDYFIISSGQLYLPVFAPILVLTEMYTRAKKTGHN